MSTPKLSIAERLELARSKLRQESKSESESESESEEEEFDYDTIEDPDERELILNIERTLDLYKASGFDINNVTNYITSDIDIYRDKKGEPYDMTTISTDSTNTSDKISSLKNIFCLWLGITALNYGAMAIFRKLFR